LLVLLNCCRPFTCRVQDKRLRYLQTLRSNIAKQTQTGVGSQQGKAAS
jgi:hypothetical protein